MAVWQVPALRTLIRSALWSPLMSAISGVLCAQPLPDAAVVHTVGVLNPDAAVKTRACQLLFVPAFCTTMSAFPSPSTSPATTRAVLSGNPFGPLVHTAGGAL